MTTSNYNRPLSYLSAQCVLQYMNPGLRITLAQRCPVLDSIHHRVPIRVTNLTVNPTQLTIDNTFYKLGIIKIYNNKNTPLSIRNENFSGGKTYDVDVYGFKKGGTDHPGYWGREVLNPRSKVSQLRKQKEEVERIVGPETGKISIISFNIQIEQVRAEMLPYELRENGDAPTYTHYLQLSTTKKSGRTFERFEYKGSILDAFQYFLTKILYGKNFEIKHLKYCGDSKSIKELLPQTLTVETLQLSGPSETLSPYMVPTRKLIIDGLVLHWDDCAHLCNRIHMNQGEVIEIGKLIDECQKPWKGIETHYSMNFRMITRERHFEAVKTLPGAQIGVVPECRDSKIATCVTFPKNNELEINVWLDRTSNLHVKVHPRGYATTQFGDH